MSTTENSGQNRGSVKNLAPYQFKPGQSGNPGGRPKRDLAAEIARAIFERDAEAIRCTFTAELRKGNPKVFTALADRAYGKPRQSLDFAADTGGPGPVCVRVEFVKPEITGQGE
jgi:hypothetical protein